MAKIQGKILHRLRSSIMPPRIRSKHTCTCRWVFKDGRSVAADVLEFELNGFDELALFQRFSSSSGI